MNVIVMFLILSYFSTLNNINVLPYSDVDYDYENYTNDDYYGYDDEIDNEEVYECCCEDSCSGHVKYPIKDDYASFGDDYFQEWEPAYYYKDEFDDDMDEEIFDDNDDEYYYDSDSDEDSDNLELEKIPSEDNELARWVDECTEESNAKIHEILNSNIEELNQLELVEE